MQTIVRRILKGKRKIEYSIYTLDDVKNGLFIEPYSYWKDIQPGMEGKWAIGDDGYIGQILKVNEYRVDRRSTKTNLFVKLSYGNNFIRKHTKMLFEDRQKVNGWNYIKPQHWTDSLARQEKTKRIARVTARMILNGRIDYARIGRMHRPDHLIPEATGRRLLKVKQVKEMVMKEVEDVLDKVGLDKHFVADSAKKMIELALGTGDLKAGAKLLEISAKWLGMELPKKIETQENTLVLNHITNAIEQAKQTKRIKTTERKMISEGEDTSTDRTIDGTDFDREPLRIQQSNSSDDGIVIGNSFEPASISISGNDTDSETKEE